MNKRTATDFSKHEHRIEIFKNENGKEIQIDHFQVGDSRMHYIKFTNTDENLIVTGDYGSWIFCRPFVPSPDGYVSGGYWMEKLTIGSVQKPYVFDSDIAAADIKELIDSGLENYGYEGEKLEKAKEWFRELLENCDDELDYQSKAYRDCYKPDFIDYEEIPSGKKVHPWLEVIFDAFDEMCERLKK
jgi:hypothetical protein